MDDNTPYYYNESPKRLFNLESCWRVESKTRQFPFVVASDLSAPVTTSQPSVPNDGETDSQTQIPTPTVSFSDLLKGALTGHFVKPVQSSQLSSSDISNGESGEDEIDPKKQASREFLVFHDVEHYLNLKEQYPHCHEIIRSPTSQNSEHEFGEKSYRDDLCRGRLIFDFDLEKPLPEMESICHMKSLASSFNGSSEQPVLDPSLFVPPNFKQIIEYLVVLVFKTYYNGVDATKMMFIWQITRHNHKFSMHLIVKHAYFSEYWVKQMRIFYCLFCRVATISGCGNIIKTIDLQMARRNATFRILGCSKIGGKELELDSCTKNGENLLDRGYPLSIYDCLVGIYHVDQLKDEQCISMDNINYIAIEREVEKTRSEPQTDDVKKFQMTVKKQISIAEENRTGLDLNDKCIEAAIALFDKFNDGTFSIRDQIGNIINLNRRRSAPCPISGARHDSDNAYLKLLGNGRVIFVCYRGCKKGNFYGFDLGSYLAPGTITLPPKDKEELDDPNFDDHEDDDSMIEHRDVSTISNEHAKEKIVYINPKKFEAVMRAQVYMVGVDIENPGTFVRKTPVKPTKVTYTRKKDTLPKRAAVINSSQSIYIPEGLKFPKFTTAK